MTEVMDLSLSRNYNGGMRDFDAWLHDLATRPLPGGVSAAALASAMGTALVAKATRVSVQRQDVGEPDRALLQAVLDLACNRQQVLLDLAEADEGAYRAVLESRPQGHGIPATDEARRRAIEVPLQVAEACHLLLSRLPGILDLCWPPVAPDLQVGQWLLEVGLRAGLSAAEGNMRAWPDAGEPGLWQARLGALRQALDPGPACPLFACCYDPANNRGGGTPV